MSFFIYKGSLLFKTKTINFMCNDLDLNYVMITGAYFECWKFQVNGSYGICAVTLDLFFWWHIVCSSLNTFCVRIKLMYRCINQLVKFMLLLYARQNKKVKDGYVQQINSILLFHGLSISDVMSCFAVNFLKMLTVYLSSCANC